MTKKIRIYVNHLHPLLFPSPASSFLLNPNFRICYFTWYQSNQIQTVEGIKVIWKSFRGDIADIMPVANHFWVFDSVCYVLVADQPCRSKFDKKDVRCIIIRYDPERRFKMCWSICKSCTRLKECCIWWRFFMVVMKLGLFHCAKNLRKKSIKD